MKKNHKLFWLAMKQYCLSHSCRATIAELRLIAKARFAAIFERLGGEVGDKPCEQALTAGFAFLQMWNEAKPCFTKAVELNKEDVFALKGFVKACVETGDHLNANQALDPVRSEHPDKIRWHVYQDETSGDLDGATSSLVIGKARWFIPLKSSKYGPGWIARRLGRLYASKNEWDGVIRSFAHLVKREPSWWAGRVLQSAYLQTGTP